MRRPFRRGFQTVKKPITTSYIDVSSYIGLAASVDANYSLLIASDSPNKALVTDMVSVVAQYENNSRIRKGSFLKLHFLPTTTPSVVTIWVYMNTKGMVVAPTDGDDFSQLPLTLANAQLREYTIFYKQVSLDVNHFRTVHIPLFSRRNSFMADGSILVLAIDNQWPDTAISFGGYGRIRTSEG